MGIHVSWQGGVWWIGRAEDPEPIQGGRAALEQWLADHGAGRTDLNFGGSRALEQMFIHDFGPLTASNPSPAGP